MIIENTTQYELRERWNRHLSQNILEINLDGEWRSLGALIVGQQNFMYAISSSTTLPRQIERVDCDLQLASTTLYSSS